MKLNLSKEMLDKATDAKSVHELIALLSESGTQLSPEEAKALYEKLHSQSTELSDNEIENVAGGKMFFLEGIGDIYIGDILPKSMSSHTHVCDDGSLAHTEEAKKFVAEISQSLSSDPGEILDIGFATKNKLHP